MSDGKTARSRVEILSTSTVRVLIVDDHELLRDGLTELLSHKSGLEVCGEAAGEDEAMEAIVSTQPNLVIVDVSLQQGDGIRLVERIRVHDKSIRVIVCSMYDENLYAERSLRTGASGYVHKQAPAVAMLDAIARVMAGETYTSSPQPQPATASSETTPLEDIESLAKRELQVLTLIGQGLMNAQIADRLGLSPRTVDTYRERIKAKLNLKTASELSRRAVQWVLQCSGYCSAVGIAVQWVLQFSGYC